MFSINSITMTPPTTPTTIRWIFDLFIYLYKSGIHQILCMAIAAKEPKKKGEGDNSKTVRWPIKWVRKCGSGKCRCCQSDAHMLGRLCVTLEIMKFAWNCFLSFGKMEYGILFREKRSDLEFIDVIKSEENTNQRYRLNDNHFRGGSPSLKRTTVPSDLQCSDARTNRFFYRCPKRRL